MVCDSWQKRWHILESMKSWKGESIFWILLNCISMRDSNSYLTTKLCNFSSVSVILNQIIINGKKMSYDLLTLDRINTCCCLSYSNKRNISTGYWLDFLLFTLVRVEQPLVWIGSAANINTNNIKVKKINGALASPTAVITIMRKRGINYKIMLRAEYIEKSWAVKH